MYEDFNYEVGGRLFLVQVEQDDISAPPWKEFDGHGPVRWHDNGRSNNWSRKPSKRAGERELGDHCLYDWREATKIALRDGWGMSPHRRPPDWDTLSARQKARLAVEADYEFLKAWCEEDWVYACVWVKYFDPDTEMDEDTEALHDECVGGVEYWPCEPCESTQLLRLQVRFVGNGKIVENKNAHLMEVVEGMAGEINRRLDKAIADAKKEELERAYWAERDVVTK